MLFNSIQYAVFLFVVFTLYWLIPHKYRWVLLIISSYYFYMCWSQRFGLLLLSITLITYYGAILIENASGGKRKGYLIALICICVGVLFVFKYLNFTLNTLSSIFELIGINFSPVLYNIVLPVGISFYIFQTMSYLIDVYRGNMLAEKHIGIYAAYVCFFPKLAEGPIERAGNIIYQLKEEQAFSYDKAVYGLELMLWGFFKKLAVADVLGNYVDIGYSNLSSCNTYDIYLLVFFYSIQIYCDFSGYSDIAIGSAKLLGIDLNDNFKSPYFARNIKEFWSRWHISLSTWFRDYVYIPLGGNRCSKTKSYINLLITFLVSGLWHGASWTFVLWGGLHGVGQIIEKATGIYNLQSKKIVCYISTLFTFVFVSVCWVFFRSNSITDANYVVKRFLMPFKYNGINLSSTIGISLIELAEIILCVFIVAVFDCVNQKTNALDKINSGSICLRWFIYIVMIWLIWLLMPLSGSSEFVYFQF